MAFRKFLLSCILGVATLSATAADYPEKLYLVGNMNNWTLPASGSQIEIPSIGDGKYSANLSLSAEYDSRIEFKVFNTMADSWDNEEEYYGAYINNSSCGIYKDHAAEWPMVNGMGYPNFIINNVSVLNNATITIDLESKWITLESADAPDFPTEITLVRTGSESSEYNLTRNPNDPNLYSATLTLSEGPLSFYFKGNNGFTLGCSEPTTDYLWKDYNKYLWLFPNQTNPITFYNWKGGDVNVSVNISNCQSLITSSSQPSLPESISMVIMENGKPGDTRVTIPFTEDRGGAAYYTTFKYWGGPLEFAIDVPNTGMLYTFSESMDLYQDEIAFIGLSPYYTLPITITNLEEGDEVSILIDAYSFSQLLISSSTDKYRPRSLYLIGSPQGWDISNDSMNLNQIGSELFEAVFDMPENPMFRFYTSLGDWERNSIGSQEIDLPIKVSIPEDGELKVDMTFGKGSWDFPGRPAGKMYMIVNTAWLYAIFSDSEISGVKETLKADGAKIAIVDGGLLINSESPVVISDLTGRVVAKVTGNQLVSLDKGIYIANGKKLFVR